MHTSVIRYRVADFLGEHPPFDAVSLEDRLAFAGTGRVSFHEDDVYLYRKGDPRGSLLWVIQQGRVELLDESPAGERLWDVLGPGDILGAARAESATYPLAARTASEAILYAFDVGELDALVGRYPAAARYLAAHVSATARHTKALRAPGQRDRLMSEREKSGWLATAGGLASLDSRRSLLCGPDLGVHDLATLLGGPSGAVAVVKGDGLPIGLVTRAELCASVASGDAATAGAVMTRAYRTAKTGLGGPEYALEMVRGRASALVLTDDGTSGSPVRGVVTADELALDGGRNPVLLVAATCAAESVGDLAHARARTDALVADVLVGPSAVEWCWSLVAEIDAALVERLVTLCKRDMERAGWLPPSVSSCWLVFGRAGRGELLAAEAPELGLVHTDPATDELERTAAYFDALAGLVSARLPHCGLRPSTGADEPRTVPVSASLSEWCDRFAARVRDPIGSGLESFRSSLDGRVACGDGALGAALAGVVAAEAARTEAFVPVLANDTIATLPPLTFLRDHVIGSDGAAQQAIDLEGSAIAPVVDAARVFALATGRSSEAATLRRLETAAAAMPQYASILDDAAEGFRILAYHDALARRARSEDAALVTPSRLGRFEQRMLKSAFDMARRFVDLTYTVYNPSVAR